MELTDRLRHFDPPKPGQPPTEVIRALSGMERAADLLSKAIDTARCEACELDNFQMVVYDREPER